MVHFFDTIEAWKPFPVCIYPLLLLMNMEQELFIFGPGLKPGTTGTQ